MGYTKTKKDNKWNYEIINRILKDENYTGTLVQGKRRNESYISHKEVKNSEADWIKYENHHEPIIDKEKLKIQRRKSNKNDILDGYLFCADCGAPMTLVKGKNKEYYYCRNSLNKKICTKHSIRKDYLYAELLRLINLKKLKKGKIKEIDREFLANLVNSIIVYENNKVNLILKHESDFIQNEG